MTPPDPFAPDDDLAASRREVAALSERRDALRDVERQALAIERAVAKRDAAIRAAHATGASLRSIAERADVSHTRVAEIVRVSA